MSNKFKRAIEQRVDIKEDSLIEEGASVEKSDNHEKKTIKIEDEPDLMQNESQNNGFDLSSIIKKDERRAKNKTFYLDEDVIDAITKTAKKQKIAESKLVNDILKHVLGNKL